MGTVVRLYLGWRLFRLIRPLLVAALLWLRCSPSAPATWRPGTRQLARSVAESLQ